MKDEKTKLIIKDNAIYEIDLECMRKKEEREKRQHKRLVEKLEKEKGHQR